MSQGAQKLYGLINYSNQRKRNYLFESLLETLSFVVLKGMIYIREKTVSLPLVARIQQLQAHHPELGSNLFRIYDSVKLISNSLVFLSRNWWINFLAHITDNLIGGV